MEIDNNSSDEREDLLPTRTSEATRKTILWLLENLREKAISHIEWCSIETYISNIPEGENILSIRSSDGYNLLQRAVGFKCVELVKWILNRECEVNSGPCSLPLHIAAFHGTKEIVELLLKHGACVDIKAKMCFPGLHSENCKLIASSSDSDMDMEIDIPDLDQHQSAEYYAIDGDQSEILKLLLDQRKEFLQHNLNDPYLCQQKMPLLHYACKQGSWNCVQYLVSERPKEINRRYDGNYAIHHTVSQDFKFLELLIKCGAKVNVRSDIHMQRTVLDLVLSGNKSARETLQTIIFLLDHGCRDLINEPDKFRNAPLHTLILRYGNEELRFGDTQDPMPWNKSDMLCMVNCLLENGAGPSINQIGNSALVLVFHHIRDLQFRYELLEMLLKNGGNPNCVGINALLPLTRCFNPLIEEDNMESLTLNEKEFCLNYVRLFCKYGANPNYCTWDHHSPLEALFRIASYILTDFNREVEKNNGFSFIKQLLIIFLQHVGDEIPDHVFPRSSLSYLLLDLMYTVKNVVVPSLLERVHDVLVLLLQYGANPNFDVNKRETMVYFSRDSVHHASSSNWVLYHYVSSILVRDFYQHDKEQVFRKVMYLFYYAMNSKELYMCLDLILKRPPQKTLPDVVTNILNTMCSQPRTLKQIARVAIYSAMNYRVAQNIDQLLLPNCLKSYMLEWTP